MFARSSPAHLFFFFFQRRRRRLLLLLQYSANGVSKFMRLNLMPYYTALYFLSIYIYTFILKLNLLLFLLSIFFFPSCCVAILSILLFLFGFLLFFLIIPSFFLSFYPCLSLTLSFVSCVRHGKKNGLSGAWFFLHILSSTCVFCHHTVLPASARSSCKSPSSTTSLYF